MHNENTHTREKHKGVGLQIFQNQGEGSSQVPLTHRGRYLIRHGGHQQEEGHLGTLAHFFASG